MNIICQMLGSKLKKSKSFEASVSFFPQKFNVVCVNLLQSYSNHLLRKNVDFQAGE